MRFLALMVRFPMLAFAYGLELIAKTVHEWERGASQTNRATAPVESTNAKSSIHKELNQMVDMDMSSDELKVVRYRIIFKKRDYETELETGEALVNYSTDGGSYGALKIMEYFEKVAAGAVRKPAKWAQTGYLKNQPELRWKIPLDDRKYIGFLYEVIRREERQEKEYDREQVKALREIEHTLARRSREE
jgi:hypothetical protein